MKPFFVVGAALLVSACSGGGSDSVNLTPSAPSVTLNSSFGATMQGVRMARNPGIAPLVYDQQVGQAAQIHANDMFTRDYDSVTILGRPGEDIGDRVTGQGYTWEDIEMLIDRGERTVSEQATIFANDNTSCGVATICVDQPSFEHFGVGRAGSGANMRWVFVMTDPNT